jgi:thymidylate synthase
MNLPLVVSSASLQDAYLNALATIRDHGWSCWNLVVQITEPQEFDSDLHDRMNALADQAGVKRPKDVAYTIFPVGVRLASPTTEDFYDRYISRFFPRVHRRAHRWGTYFERMIAWSYRDSVPMNQLDAIIQSVNKHPNTVHRAAYTILISRPGGDTRQPTGAPCLNFLALQLEKEPVKTMNLLAVYRNHDFLSRAYGNYWGLCQLLGFLADETGYEVGRLTCVSSRAFVGGKKTLLRELLADTGR